MCVCVCVCVWLTDPACNVVLYDIRVGLLSHKHTATSLHPGPRINWHFIAPVCKTSGQTIPRTLLQIGRFWSYYKSSYNTVRFHVKILLHANVEKKKNSLRSLNFAILVVVSSDIVAVNGLTFFMLLNVQTG